MFKIFVNISYLGVIFFTFSVISDQFYDLSIKMLT